MGMVIGFSLFVVAIISFLMCIFCCYLNVRKANKLGFVEKFKSHTLLYSIPVWLAIYYFPVSDYSEADNFEKLILILSIKTSAFIFAPALVGLIVLITKYLTHRYT